MGGLFTEAKPEALPPGASPRSINNDYIIGSVKPRPGKFSAFTYADEFFESPANFTKSVGNGSPWSGGSVTLNQGGTGGCPIPFAANLGHLVGAESGNTVNPTITVAGSLNPVHAGETMFLALYTNPSGTPAIDVSIVSIIDQTHGATWSQIGATQTFQAGGNPSPNNTTNFQLFTAIAPVDFFGNVTLLITYSGAAHNHATYGTFAWSNLGALQQVLGDVETTTNPTGPTVSGSANRNFIISFLTLAVLGAIPVANPFFVLSGFYVNAAVYHDPTSGAYAGVAGSYTPHWNPGGPVFAAIINAVYATESGCGGGGTGPISQTLQALNFNLDIPVNVPQGQVASGCGDTFGFVTPTTLPVTGVEVEITGSQTDDSPDAVLKVQLQLPDGTLSPEINTVQLPASPGTVIVGSPTDLWGFTAAQLNAAILNDQNFTVNIVAEAPGGEVVTFTASVEVLVAFSVPDPPPDINYLKTFEQQDGDLFTLVLGSNGVIYREDVINAPNVLIPVYTEIEPDSFAESCTQDDREFIAVSDLQHGTDMPYGYDGTNFDRLSQVGPGAPPSASGSSVGGTIPIVSITQPPVMSDPEAPGRFEDLLWSAGPGDTSPGNVLTVYYGRSFPPGPLHVPDPNLAIGVGVNIAGASPINGEVINGDYVVTAVGEGIPPGGEYGRWFFTVQQTITQYANRGGGVGNGPSGTYQVTTATLTASQQVPNVQVGTKIEIAGTGGSPPAGYDGAWVVTKALNAAQMLINSTQRTVGVATYAFTLLSGTAPVAGQQVSVGGTLNGNGVFNVRNATIQSATAGTFLLSLPGPDIPVAAENGTGIIFGTKFTFEPGTPVGTRTTGTVVATGGQFSSGQRKLCYSFLTRNGYVTQPSPIATVDITIGSTGITVSNLLTGPSDVIARIVHFTAAGGGQFYNIPIPVLVTDPVTGQVIVNDSTWINDNTTTTATFSFSDDVLLAADEIDIQGNNLFEDIELGSSLMFIPYASRLFAIGEQNKVFNFVNWSFDGGIAGGPGGTTYPAGWTVDPVNGAGGSMVNSPLFGFAYQISNQTGSPQALYGMITQDAFQDENSVAIIDAATTYSIRVTAAAAAAIGSGTLVADLFSPSLGVSLGSFAIPLSSLTTKMQIFTGTILTAALSPVPKDLVWRIYAANIPDGAIVLIDREEPFPTEQPNLNTQIIGSYQGNFEAFDRLTGPIQCGVQNQQPVRSAFTLFDALYIVKTGSFLAVADNNTTEPAFWNRPRVISNSVGTPSIYGVTSGIDDPNSGEEWSLIFGRTGLYIFNGGEPVKLTEEIQSVIDQVNWRYGHTLWIKNDIDKRRILIGVPMKTYTTNNKGNIVRPLWFPEGVIPDDPNPSTPNVVLELYYGQLNTASSLSDRVGVHQSYSGKLIASEVTRKWSIWTIKAPAAAFLKRQDSTVPIFLGNSDGNGKIFELVDGLLEDDGSPFMQLYIPYGFAQSQDSEARGLNVVRMSYQYMTLVIDGSGSLTITAFPNTLDSVYTHTVDPPLDLPASTNGDVELPLNESASRLFVQFGTQCVGAGFILTRIVMVMRQEPWSPVRGVNE